MAELYYDDSKDLYEGLIIEIDGDMRTQIAHVFPAGREYGFKFAVAPALYEALKAVYKDAMPEKRISLNTLEMVSKALAKAEIKVELSA